MSRIDKMSIQGIRSFSPASHEKIEIFTPVTLILGPNGTGKTTIIECLKYATTGELPPGTKGGGCFVHDPKLVQEVEVKAKVGLTVKDVSGHNMIVTRSLQATQKSKTIQMRTLDGVIKRQSADGEWKSISSKCAELDREMVSSLGVSKPVLESVIFCHQEDSNWPLSEGKAVKQRFDDIFASTRYVKALESIRKTKIDQDLNAKTQKVNVAHLKEQTAKAAEVRADYDEAKSNLEAQEHFLTEVTDKLDPLKRDLNKFRQQYQRLCTVEANIGTREHEKKLLTEAVGKLRANISSDFEGSDSDLQATIFSAADSLASMEAQSSSLEREVGKARHEVEQLASARNRLLVQKGKQEQEREAVEQNQKQLRQLTEEYSRKEGMTAAFDSEVSMEDHAEFLGALKGKQRASEAEVAEKRSQFEEREMSIQKDLDKQRGSISRLEESKKLKLQLLEGNRRQLRGTRGKLAEAESSVDRLAKAQAKLEKAEAKVTSAEETGSVRILKREIEAEKEALAGRDREMAALEEQVAGAVLRADKLAERSLVEREAKEKEASARRLRAKLSDSLEQVFCGEPPRERLRTALEEKLQDLQEANRRQAEKLQSSRASLTTLETEVKLGKEQLEAKRQRLRAVEEQLEAVCGSAGFEEALRACTEKKKALEEDYAFIQGSVATYRKFKERLDRDRACPLCHRGFDSALDADELSEELAKKLSLAPKDLRNKERERQSVSAKYDALQQLTALPQEAEALRTAQVPELERQLAAKQRRAAEVSREVENGDSVLELQTGDESEAKSIQGDVVLLERFEAELRAANERLRALNAAAGEEQSGASLEELQRRKTVLRAEMKAADESLEDKRAAVERENEALERLRSNVGRLRDECRALEQLNADKVHLAGEASKLEAEGARLEAEVAEEERRFSPLREAILALEKEQKELRRRKEATLEAERRRGRELGRWIDNLERPLAAVRSYAEAGKETRLRQLLRKIEEAEAAFQEKERGIAEREASLAKVRDTISNHRVRQRELLDCQEVREKEAAVTALEAELAHLRAEVGGIRVKELQRNLQKLEKQEDELLKRKEMTTMKKTQLMGQLKQLEKELDSALYKDAMKKYTGALHELKTTEVAVADLEKYYRALDRAIMTYHAYKMEEINKIVKELWRNTYRGNDIDFIEIRSDEDEAGVSKSRRTYNYRVVMVKADTALDMRGRCSAGQKVLASLIIRMALSEAFCLNCGVLALDEPTTNLDRENIESLAYALVEIIKARSKQKNFQLIVITHDEDFVELLGRSEFVEHFFRISRTTEGLSRIRKVKIEEEFR